MSENETQNIKSYIVIDFVLVELRISYASGLTKVGVLKRMNDISPKAPTIVDWSLI